MCVCIRMHVCARACIFFFSFVHWPNFAFDLFLFSLCPLMSWRALVVCCALRCAARLQLWNNIGMCFFAKRRFLAAVACLKRALAIAPFEWLTSYNLGTLRMFVAASAWRPCMQLFFLSAFAFSLLSTFSPTLILALTLCSAPCCVRAFLVCAAPFPPSGSPFLPFLASPSLTACALRSCVCCWLACAALRWRCAGAGRAGAPSDGPARLGVPLPLRRDQPQARLPLLLHVPRPRAHKAGRL